MERERDHEVKRERWRVWVCRLSVISGVWESPCLKPLDELMDTDPLSDQSISITYLIDNHLSLYIINVFFFIALTVYS